MAAPDKPVPMLSLLLNRIPRNRLDWLVAVMIVGYIGVGASLALARHNAFHTFVLDLGYYTQVIWNTSQGRWFATTLQGPISHISLSDHFSPMLAILAPLFWIAPDARTLILVLVVVVAFSILPAYVLVRERYPALAVVLVLAFMINPLVHQQTLEEFHDIVLAAPTLMLALYALYRDRLRLLLITLALTLLVREDAGIYVASFGLFMLVCQPARRWWGLGLMIVGAAWVVVVLFVLKPGSSYTFLPKSSGPIGLTSIPLILRGAMERTGLSFSNGGRITDLLSIFAALVGLPLLAGGEQFLWAPMMIFLITISGGYPGDLFGYRAAALVPLLWVSVARLLSRLPLRWASTGAALLLVGSLVGSWLWSPFPGGGRYDASDFEVTQHDRIGETILAKIPPDASLASQDGVGAHLTTRQKVYLFPMYDHSKPPEMIVLDVNSKLYYPFQYPEKIPQNVYAFQLDPTMQLFWEQDGYYVFRHDPAAPIPHQGPWTWSPWLRLEGYDLAQTDHAGAFISTANSPGSAGTMRVALYWTSLAPMSVDYTVSVFLVAADGFIAAQNDSWPGRGTLETTQWKVGRLIRDVHYLDIPPGRQPEELQLQVVVYDLATRQRLAPESGFTLTVLKPGS